MKEVKIKVPDPDEFLPEEFKEHMLNAARELLLAIKCLIDAKLESLGKVEETIKRKKDVKKIEIE